MTSNKYQINVIKKLDETLIEQWEKLWDKGANANIFNSYQWFLTCQKTFSINNYEIYTCYKDNNLAAIMPVFSTKCFGVKTTGSIANKYIAGTPFLIDEYDETLIKYLFDSIISKRSLHLAKIDIRTTVLLQRKIPDIFFSLISVNPYLELSNDPLRFVSKKNLYKLKRIVEKNKTNLDFKIYDNKNDLNKYLELMFDIEQKSAKKYRSMDLFSKKENRDLYKNIIKYCSQFVNLCFLYYENKPIAYTLNFIYNKICLAFQTSYLFEYRKFSPGKIMTLYMLEKLKDNSIQFCDFSGGLSSFKQEFTDKYYLQYDLYYSKNKLVRNWWKSINLARRIKQIIFPKKHTLDHKFLFKTQIIYKNPLLS